MAGNKGRAPPGSRTVAGQTGVQRQTQRAILAPQLYRQMDLIHMAVPELRAHLEMALYQNPMLELEEAEEDLFVDLPEEDEESQEDELDWEEMLLDDAPYRGSSTFDAEEYGEPMVVAQKSLHDHLLGQIGETRVDGRMSVLCEEIVWNIDDEGILGSSLDEILWGLNAWLGSTAGHTDYTGEEAEAALAVVQSFDPPGVGARDRAEALSIQLWQRGEEHSLAYLVLHGSYAEILKGRWAEVARILAVPEPRVRQTMERLSGLNPRPGSHYSPELAPTVIPDLSVVESGGEFLVSLNDRALPRLRISASYRDAVESGRFDEKTEEFITERLGAARWMVQALEQRRRTIVRVMEYIVEHQSAFLEKGDKHLKPMTLSDVAEATGMHQSTVSRVTNDKYVDTPRGVLPLRYFFSAALATGFGGEVSATAVQAQIKTLVGEEDPKKPLSDSRIAELLRRQDIRVARRTVAKYRGKLGILPARMRKSP